MTLATYAIGDIQGCQSPLERLLDRLAFDPQTDRLLFTGDLVNRGSDSLAVLRFVRSLGDSAVTVLGNHDLHLLAVAARVPGARLKRRDTLTQVLDAPDGGELLEWLRMRPMAHFESTVGWLVVHAGVPPQWDLAQTLASARELERTLHAPDYRRFLEGMYGDEPTRWSDDLSGLPRLRFIVNCLTRMRFVTRDGHIDLASKGPPGTQPKGLVPWFRVAGRASADTSIVFGHWSALGALIEPQLRGIDTGCVWGNRLTAVRLDRNDPPVSVPCEGCADPDG